MNSKDTARTCVPPRRWPCVGRDETNSLSGGCVYLLGLRRAPMRTYGPGLVYARRTYHQWCGRDVRTYIPYTIVLTRRKTQPTNQPTTHVHQGPKLPVFTSPRREGLRFTRPNKIQCKSHSQILRETMLEKLNIYMPLTSLVVLLQVRVQVLCPAQRSPQLGCSGSLPDCL